MNLQHVCTFAAERRGLPEVSHRAIASRRIASRFNSLSFRRLAASTLATSGSSFFSRNLRAAPAALETCISMKPREKKGHPRLLVSSVYRGQKKKFNTAGSEGMKWPSAHTLSGPFSARYSTPRNSFTSELSTRREELSFFETEKIRQEEQTGLPLFK